jgi:CRISPR-associated protein Csx14
MSNATPTISIPVDLTNPGQFFACCGLFELADRLWPGAEAWFEGEVLQSTFQILASRHQSNPKVPLYPNLRELLDFASTLRFDVGNAEGGAEDTDEGEDDASLDPIVIDSPIRLVLDWWSDRSIKPWAGSMKERPILNAMLSAIDTTIPDPLNYSRPVFDPSAPVESGKRARKPKKREPFYFDCRRGSNAHPLDSGFSPDKHHMESCCFPAVEAMAFVGLQRCRPAPTDAPNRSMYTAWTASLPVNAIGPVVCGMVHIPGSLAFTFDNFFRTDQRKHKSYSRATRTRSNNV